MVYTRSNQNLSDLPYEISFFLKKRKIGLWHVSVLFLVVKKKSATGLGKKHYNYHLI